MDGQEEERGEEGKGWDPGEAKKGEKEREAKKGEELKILPLPAESRRNADGVCGDWRWRWRRWRVKVDDGGMNLRFTEKHTSTPRV